MANLKNTSIQDRPFKLPIGSTSQRPVSSDGRLRYNTETNSPEIYNGSNWSDSLANAQTRQSKAAVVPLVTTSSVDVGGSITKRSVFSTNPTFNTGTYSVTNSGVTVNEPGYYEVYATCVFFTSSGQRQSYNTSFFVNSERQTAVSNSSYMRNTTDDVGGNTLNSIFLLEAGDEVGLGFSKVSGSGESNLIGNDSSFWIRKLPRDSKFAFLNGRQNTAVNDTATFTSRDFLQYISDDRTIITADLNTLGVTDYRNNYIEVTESGLYEMYANCKFLQTGPTQGEGGGYRYRVGIRFTVNNSALPYISDSSYTRNTTGHIDGSTNIKVIQNLNAGDRIRIEFRQETENDSEGPFRLEANDSVYGIRKIN